MMFLHDSEKLSFLLITYGRFFFLNWNYIFLPYGFFFGIFEVFSVLSKIHINSAL